MRSSESTGLRLRAELAMAATPDARRPLLFELVGWALTDFDAVAARSYLEELEADRGLSADGCAQVALHRGAYEVLCGNLFAAERAFAALLDDPQAPESVRAEAGRGLALVRFEQIAPAVEPAAAEDDAHKASFWTFIDVLMASERDDARELGALIRPLDSVDPRSTYLATAHALGESAISEARAAVEAAAERGAARLATACWILGVLEGRSNTRGAQEKGAAALLEAERLLHPDTFQVLSARAERALILLDLGATDAARQLASDVLDRAEARGAHLRSAVAQVALAEVARRERHRGEAESRASRALDLLYAGRLRGMMKRVAGVLGGELELDAAARATPVPVRAASLAVPAPSDPRLVRVVAGIRAVLGRRTSGPAPNELAAELGAARLAAKAGLSREHLTRKLAAELGLTLRDLVARERAAIAVERLEAGESSDTVATSLGFSDARALRRALLRVAGKTLRETRRGSTK